jgi:hypothetical protein
MGGGASRLNTKSPLAILSEAEEAKKAPEEVIRWILANADFNDMMDLVNLEKCRLYMWQGMKLVKRVDQVPRGELSIDQQRYENNRCFQRSRYYVFLMQNVMALGLTTCNAQPLKRDTVYRFNPIYRIGLNLLAAAPAEVAEHVSRREERFARGHSAKS